MVMHVMVVVGFSANEMHIQKYFVNWQQPSLVTESQEGTGWLEHSPCKVKEMHVTTMLDTKITQDQSCSYINMNQCYNDNLHAQGI